MDLKEEKKLLKYNYNANNFALAQDNNLEESSASIDLTCLLALHEEMPSYEHIRIVELLEHLVVEWLV